MSRSNDWCDARIKGTPAAEIGRVQAQDADEAIKIAIEQYEVAPAFRGRLWRIRCGDDRVGFYAVVA